MTARSPEAVLEGALALLAPGWALPRDPGSVLGRLLSAPAGEIAAAEGAGVALLEEADPRTTAVLLDAWERVAGLPDPCLGPAPTLAQRRARLLQQLTRTSGQSAAFFAGIAASLGYPTATVTEFREHECEQDCETATHDAAWRFAWRLDLPATVVTESACEDDVETPLAVWGDTAVECVLRALAPAHTTLLVAYG